MRRIAAAPCRLGVSHNPVLRLRLKNVVRASGTRYLLSGLCLLTLLRPLRAFARWASLDWCWDVVSRRAGLAEVRALALKAALSLEFGRTVFLGSGH